MVLTYDINKRTKDVIQWDIWDDQDDDGDQSNMAVTAWTEMNYRLLEKDNINKLSRKDGKPMTEDE